MRNLKKVLALVLALVMSLSLVTIANAADFTDADDISYEEAVDVMTAIGVIEGLDTGAFNPTGTLTREQAAKIIATMMLGDSADKLGTTSSSFTDVAVTRWSSPYIEYCASIGIIAGNGDGTFNPTGKLTGHAFAKMLLGALGYNADTEGYVGSGWSIEVAKDAVTAGIDVDGVAMNAELTREQAAQMAFQTLQATMVEYKQAGTVIVTPDGTTVTTAGSTASKVETSSSSSYNNDNDGYVQFCEEYFEDLKVDTDSSDDLGRPANEWAYDGDNVGTYAKAADDTTVINPDDAATMRTVLTSGDYFNLKSSNIGTVSYYLNGESKTAGTALAAGDVVEIFKTNGKVTTVAVARYTLAKVDDVDTDVSSADAKNDITAYISLESLGGTAIGAGTYNDTDINGYNASTYVEDAYLAVAMDSASKIVDSYVADTAEGAVTTYKSSAVTIGGTKYSIVATPDANSVTSFDFDNTNYIAYLTKEGYVLAIDGTEAVKLDDVYYVYGTYYTKAANGNQTFYALVVDMEGKKSEIEIEASTYVNTFGKDAAADTFQKVDLLYTFTDKDTKDSSGNNANGDAVSAGSTVTNVADPKANNGKFSAVVYDSAAAGGDFYVTDSTLNMTNGLSASSGTIVTSSGTPSKAYLNSSTKYILIDVNGTTADMDIDVYTGGAKIANTKNVIVISTKSGSSYVAQVVIAADSGVSTGVVDTNAVVYLAKKPTTQVKDGYEATLYFMDGSNKTVTVDNNDNAGFYNYSVNGDGIYELDVITNEIYGADGSVSQNYTYDDETGWVSGTIDSIFNSSKLSLTDKTVNTSYTVSVNDVNILTNTQIVDSRTTKSVYENEINTLGKLEAAMNRGSVNVSLFLDDGDVLLIAVTGMGISSNSNSAAVQSELDTTDSATISTALAQGISVTVKNGQTLTFSTAQTANHTITLKNGATLVIPGSTTLFGNAGAAYTNSGDVVVNCANGGIQVSASSGTITANSSQTIDDNDKLTLTGSAILVGTGSNTLTIDDNSVTVATSNFYDNSGNAIAAGSIPNNTYTWNADVKDDGSNIAGWKANS